MARNSLLQRTKTKKAAETRKNQHGVGCAILMACLSVSLFMTLPAWAAGGVTVTVRGFNEGLGIGLPLIQPDPEPIIITNNTSAPITLITSKDVRLLGFDASKFKLEAPASSSVTINPGAEDQSWTLQPEKELRVGLWTVDICVDYGGSEPAKATVNYKVQSVTGDTTGCSTGFFGLGTALLLLSSLLIKRK
ncbi:MAG: hypothetical protein LBC93_05665 [Synergistaceae bacterium]|nr:hypothetical protein [Synergistaceae bacterium]